MKKLIDDNGKLFGLINPIDLGVIILLFILVINVLHAYLPAPLKIQKNDIVIKLLVNDIPPYVANSIVGFQDLYQDGSDVDLGIIQAKISQPAELMIREGDKITIVQSPRNVDLHLELKCRAHIEHGARNGVYIGNSVFRIGDTVRAHTLYTSLQGKIETLTVNP